MINLEEIKTPFPDDAHKMTRLNVSTPLPSRDGIARGKGSVIHNEWFDQFGIRYCFNNSKLFITNPKELRTLLQHIDQIQSNIDVVIMINEVGIFNDLCRALQKRPTNKNIDIALTASCHFNKRQWLDFELLPSNVKVSNLYCNYREQLPIPNDFDWWGLWLNNRDFECVRAHLTPMAKERFEKMRFIAQSFYDSFSRTHGSLTSEKDKVDFVFRWMRKEISYATEATNPDGTLKRERIGYISQDPICTFERKRGVCVGRACLMKTLLNNCFMRVPCFLTSGMHNNLPHTWNEVYFPDGASSYYDLSFGVCNSKFLSRNYHRINHEDAQRGYIVEDVSSSFSNFSLPLPDRRKESSVLLPLPPRRSNGEEVAVQKKKLPCENTPPLPSRRSVNI